VPQIQLGTDSKSRCCAHPGRQRSVIWRANARPPRHRGVISSDIVSVSSPRRRRCRRSPACRCHLPGEFKRLPDADLVHIDQSGAAGDVGKVRRCTRPGEGSGTVRQSISTAWEKPLSRSISSKPPRCFPKLRRSRPATVRATADFLRHRQTDRSSATTGCPNQYCGAPGAGLAQAATADALTPAASWRDSCSEPRAGRAPAAGRRGGPLAEGYFHHQHGHCDHQVNHVEVIRRIARSISRARCSRMPERLVRKSRIGTSSPPCRCACESDPSSSCGPG